MFAQWDKLSKIHKEECIKESGVYKEDVYDIEQVMNFPDYYSFKCYLKCQLYQLQVVDTRAYLKPPLKKCSALSYLTFTLQDGSYTTIRKSDPISAEKSSRLRLGQAGPTAKQHTREHLETEWDKQLNKHKIECIKESSVNKDDVMDIGKFMAFPDYPNFKCYIKCQQQSTNLLNAEGNFNEKEILKIIEGTTEEIIRKCVQETSNDDNLCKKAYDFGKCAVTEIFASNGI
ncbi:hypothetical protein FQA39_LY08005 [Lamprigera yunnana]|nr:hypothetical protein FQA39_LY08005 [Lamprigera yunnana]